MAGKVLYIRTSDGVLLRFEDLSAVKAWIEAGKLTTDARFLGPDQHWHPVSELPDLEVVFPPQTPDQPPMDFAQRSDLTPPQGIVTRPASPGDLGVRRADAPHAQGSDQLVSSPGKVIEPLWVSQPPNVSPRARRQAGPAGQFGQAELDMWAADPEGGARRRFKRIVIAAAVAAGVTIGLVMFFAGEFFDKGAPPVQTPVAEPSKKALDSASAPAPATAPAPAAAPAPPTAPVPEHTVVRRPEEGPVGRRTDAVLPVATRPQETSPAQPQPAEGSPLAAQPAQAGSAADTYDGHMAAGNKLLSVDPAKAFSHFEYAARLAPDRAEARTKMGDALARMGQWEAAAVQYQRVLKVAPYGPAMIGLARAHDHLGHVEDARHWYGQYLESMPRGSQADEARAYLSRFKGASQ